MFAIYGLQSENIFDENYVHIKDAVVNHIFFLIKSVLLRREHQEKHLLIGFMPSLLTN